MGASAVTAHLTRVVSRQEIAQAVERLAGELNRDYRGRPLLLVGVLKGSFMFLADLVRCLEVPVQLDFVRAASYGAGTESSGRVRILSGPRIPVQGRDVVIVEDIVDRGHTAVAVKRYLRRKGVASVRLCTLLDKTQRRRVKVAIDYCGITVPDRFLVGYGLDLAEEYRQLPDIYALEEGGRGP